MLCNLVYGILSRRYHCPNDCLVTTSRRRGFMAGWVDDSDKNVGPDLPLSFKNNEIWSTDFSGKLLKLLPSDFKTKMHQVRFFKVYICLLRVFHVYYKHTVAVWRFITRILKLRHVFFVWIQGLCNKRHPRFSPCPVSRTNGLALNFVGNSARTSISPIAPMSLPTFRLHYGCFYLLFY